MLLIADSGSTKTVWCLMSEQHVRMMSTQGINPFQLDEHEISVILSTELVPQIELYGKTIGVNGVLDDIQEVVFYGAGCTREKAPVVSTALRTALTNGIRVEVMSDMMGAARGLCGQEPGIVCILGTGSSISTKFIT